MHTTSWRRSRQAVAAHPQAVARFRQVGHHVPSPVVSDDDLPEAGGQIGGLRDHPDTRLGTLGARHDAADVVGAQGRCAGGLKGQQRRQRRQRETQSQQGKNGPSDRLRAGILA